MSKQRLLNASFGYNVMSLTSPLGAASNQQLEVCGARLYNASGAPNGLGIMHSINSAQFKIYTLQVADTEVTSTLLAESAVSAFTTTNNQGVLFQAKDKFQAVAFNISQAQTGSPVYTYEYHNGSDWAALTLINTPVYSATGIQALVFQTPLDWAVGCGSEGGDSSLYSVRALATTAPSQAVQINKIAICKLLDYQGEVSDKGALEIDFEESPVLLQVGESIIPFFSYASPDNRIDISYKISP
jgi:hypothetical protein